jgi:hypothetical protein
MNQSRWSAWAGRALFECVLIVFGIVLGLAVNNWLETAQQRHRLIEVREYFAEEIRANREQLTSEMYHGEMLERMQPRELLALAEIYRAQDDLRQLNQALLTTVLAPTADSEDPRFIRSQANATSMTLNDITYAETELLKLYDRAFRVK